MEKNFSVKDFYANKGILVTGTTGFVGKAIMEKLLFSCSDLKCIYVLIRLKKGTTIQERFKKELVSSPCFDRIRQREKDNYEKWFSEKVIPLNGDLLAENLDLSIEDEQTIIENVNVIINSAASIDFNADIDYSLQINVLGPMKVLALAKKIKNLSNFVQVSTCFVNCYKVGFIEEKKLNDYENPYKLLQDLLAIDGQTMRRDTKKIIKKFPNTYTFTKNLAEQVLNQLKGKVTITIVRPAIVCPSLKEPVPGWVDRLSASSAVFMLVGLGILHQVKGDFDNIGDQIPLDLCANHIIVAGAYFSNSNELNIMHSGTSHLQPATWRVIINNVVSYFKNNPPEQAYEGAHFILTKNTKLLAFNDFKRRLPALAAFSTAKVLKNQNLKKQSAKALKILKRANSISDVFGYFGSHEWIYETKVILKFTSVLSQEEKEIFYVDVKMIDWNDYMNRFCWGMRKYALKEDVKPYEEEINSRDLNKRLSDSMFPDLRWTLQTNIIRPVSHNKDIRLFILNSSKVKEALAELIQSEETKAVNQEAKNKVKVQMEKKAKEIAKLMTASINPVTIRTMAWVLRKYFKQIYEKVIINEDVLREVKNFEYKTHGPIVFLPTHRSYIDMLILSYIIFSLGLRLPNIAVSEDFLGMFVITNLLRNCGSFFLFQEKLQYKKLYSAIFSEYIGRLLYDGCTIEFFIERSRSRTNKILEPDFTLLEIITDCIIEGKIPDAQIIPCTINYEKVIDGNTFPLELLGEEKPQDSFLRVLLNMPTLLKNYGKVYIEFSDPRSYKGMVGEIAKTTNFITLQKQENQKSNITKEIATQIVVDLENNLVIMSTSMIASLILMYRKGIDEEDLTKHVNWLSKELNSRGVKIAGIQKKNHGSATVRNSLRLLSEFLKQKKDIFEPKIVPVPDYKSVLVLSYYRYPLVTIFFIDSIISITLLSFGYVLAYKEGVPFDRLYDESNFLFSLFDHEKTTNIKKLYPEKIPLQIFNKYIEELVEKNILVFDSQTKKLIVHSNENSSFTIQFFSSLLWPTIETYWACNVVLAHVRPRENIPQHKLMRQIQWFTETMFEEKVMGHYESCSIETIKNSLRYLNDNRFIEIKQQIKSKKSAVEKIITLIGPESEFIKQKDHLQRFMKITPSRSFKPLVDGRVSIIGDLTPDAKLQYL